MLLPKINFIDRLKSKYENIQDLKTKFKIDLQNIFNYTVESVNQLTYKSSGISGIYSDIINTKNNFQHQYNIIKEDVKTLENILTKKQHTKNNTNNSGNNNKYINSINYAKQFSKDELNKIILLKNNYFWKKSEELEQIIENKTGIKINNIDAVLKDVMKLKIENINYTNIMSLHYNANIAEQSMKDEIINSYLYSNKSLKCLSLELEKKYGMHIAASTISVNARKYLSLKGLKFNNRKEAKIRYKNSNIRENIVEINNLLITD